MTRVVIIEKNGGPEVLKLETKPSVKPGPHEVLIEHKAIGLNYIDTYHRSGLYPLELPTKIGGEASGIIKEIGSLWITKISKMVEIWTLRDLMDIRWTHPVTQGHWKHGEESDEEDEKGGYSFQELKWNT